MIYNTLIYLHYLIFSHTKSMVRNLSPEIPIGTHDHGSNSNEEIYSFKGSEKNVCAYSRYRYRYR